MSKMRIYISGPISGLPYDQVRRRFEQDKKTLAMADFEPISPLENGLPPEAPWEQYMKRDLEILATCDGIYLQAGWEKSRGCQIELQTALVSPRIKYIIKETPNTAPKCKAKVT